MTTITSSAPRIVAKVTGSKDVLVQMSPSMYKKIFGTTVKTPTTEEHMDQILDKTVDWLNTTQSDRLSSLIHTKL